MAFAIRSPAFASGAMIPRKHTCEGADVSPPLAWEDPPAGTKGFALVCDDPDAPSGTWVHWVIYGIPPEARKLGEGVPATSRLADGSLQGRNDFGTVGYGGPCPPPGMAHRYFFRLYALRSQPALAPGLTKGACRKAIQGLVIATAECVGTYIRG
jgi:Raf kinase inhibitor-like YbhB/YbcL family protein